MTIIAYVYITFILAAFIVTAYNVNDWFNVFVNTKLFNKTKVYVYDGQYIFNEPFYTYIENPTEHQKRKGVKLLAKRFPATNTGVVQLFEDGTASYCGKYKWEIVK